MKKHIFKSTKTFFMSDGGVLVSSKHKLTSSESEVYECKRCGMRSHKSINDEGTPIIGKNFNTDCDEEIVKQVNGS
jgi:hypothetical protein